MSARVIYTSITKPVGVDAIDATSYGGSFEHIYPHLMEQQSIFGVRTVLNHHVLDMIAANTHAKSMVMHWPTMDDLSRAVSHHKPEYVAIALTTPSFPRAESMTKVVRQANADTKVVYGGYPPEQGSADIIMKGEGISGMRRLLGEEEREIMHPLFVAKYKMANLPLHAGSGTIYEKVGCNNHCDFCSTSAYHDGTRYLQTVSQVMDLIIRYLHTGVNNFTLFSEDHLRDIDRNGKLHPGITSLDRLVNMMCFSCMDSVMQYKPEDIYMLGYEKIWVGVEDFSGRYTKNDYARFSTFIQDMQAHGISMIVSGFIGDPSMNKEETEKVIGQILALKASLVQINIKTPLPGTPFYGKVKLATNDYRYYDGHHLVHEHPEISFQEMADMQIEAQKRDYFKNGPSTLRCIKIMYDGYKMFERSQIDSIIQRRNQIGLRLRDSVLVLDLVMQRHPNPDIVERTEELRGQIISDIGRPSYYGLKKGIVGLGGMYESAHLQMEMKFPSSTRQPRTIINMYN